MGDSTRQSWRRNETANFALRLTTGRNHESPTDACQQATLNPASWWSSIGGGTYIRVVYYNPLPGANRFGTEEKRHHLQRIAIAGLADECRYSRKPSGS